MTDTKAQEARAHHRRHHHLGHHHHHHHLHHDDDDDNDDKQSISPTEKSAGPSLMPPKPDRFRRPSQIGRDAEGGKRLSQSPDARSRAEAGPRQTRKDMQRLRSLSPNQGREKSVSMHTTDSQISIISHPPIDDETDLDEAEAQDVEELW